MSIDAMKQALEALEAWNYLEDPKPDADAITALRAAIEQAQDPVAWVCYGNTSDEKHTIDYQQEDIDAVPVGTMLYTAPRQWQGLTGEEVAELTLEHAGYPVRLTEAIEAKLREKNT